MKLTREKIDELLPKVETGLLKYMHIQQCYQSAKAGKNEHFQKAFSQFYGLKRIGNEHLDAYFTLLERQKTEKNSLEVVIEKLLEQTGKIHASFASKIVATANPKLPVIDRYVLASLRDLGYPEMRLPPHALAQDVRVVKIRELHKRMGSIFGKFLESRNGRYLVEEFKKMYPCADITETKMPDLILWQRRKKKIRKKRE